MSIAVVIAFAGALVAAVGTGVLLGRLIRAPRSDLAAWSSVLLALAVALGAQAMGFAVGFSGATFRTTALAGLLLAPLWSAWGLVELAGHSLPARFGARLATAALTIVPSVILILDPLNESPPFGKGWPGTAHYMTLPATALTVVHVATVVTALVMMVIAALRTRHDPAWWDVFVPATAAGTAVLLTVGLGLGLPSPGYPLLTTIAAGMVWFTATRSQRVRLDQLRDAQHPAAAGPVRPRHGRGSPAGAGGAVDLPARGFAVPTLPGGEPPGREFSIPPVGAGPPGWEFPGAPAAAGGSPGREPGAPALPPSATGPVQAAQSAATTPDLFGLIAIYTLLDDGGEEFDRLAERTVVEVRGHEPDTLLFVVHTVRKAPMQRIFYEVYRDRMAYEEHRRQPHVIDFFARHRPYVLATNVIELDLRYAKVSALPSLAAMFGRDSAR